VRSSISGILMRGNCPAWILAFQVPVLLGLRAKYTDSDFGEHLAVSNETSTSDFYLDDTVPTWCPMLTLTRQKHYYFDLPGNTIGNSVAVHFLRNTKYPTLELHRHQVWKISQEVNPLGFLRGQLKFTPTTPKGAPDPLMQKYDVFKDIVSVKEVGTGIELTFVEKEEYKTTTGGKVDGGRAGKAGGRASGKPGGGKGFGKDRFGGGGKAKGKGFGKGKGKGFGGYLEVSSSIESAGILLDVGEQAEDDLDDGFEGAEADESHEADEAEGYGGEEVEADEKEAYDEEAYDEEAYDEEAEEGEEELQSFANTDSERSLLEETASASYPGGGKGKGKSGRSGNSGKNSGRNSKRGGSGRNSGRKGSRGGSRSGGGSGGRKGGGKKGNAKGSGKGKGKGKRGGGKDGGKGKGKGFGGRLLGNNQNRAFQWGSASLPPPPQQAYQWGQGPPAKVEANNVVTVSGGSFYPKERLILTMKAMQRRFRGKRQLDLETDEATGPPLLALMPSTQAYSAKAVVQGGLGFLAIFPAFIVWQEAGLIMGPVGAALGFGIGLIRTIHGEYKQRHFSSTASDKIFEKLWCLSHTSSGSQKLCRFGTAGSRYLLGREEASKQGKNCNR